jgi:hypothetical protein
LEEDFPYKYTTSHHQSGNKNKKSITLPSREHTIVYCFGDNGADWEDWKEGENKYCIKSLPLRGLWIDPGGLNRIA